jgi:myo-inositol 2-dehydrogenase/D-chiro-inositol 1-dehydrogenase
MLVFAIIGTGWIGGIHADRLQRCAGARLGYAFDVNGEAARAFAAKYGCDVVASVEEACDKADAIIIASSTVSHEQVALACVAARKPFLVEKPVAHSLAAATAVRDAANAAGVAAAVGFNRRFHPGYARIRQAVAAGKIGNLESLRFTVKTATPPTPDFLKTSGGLFGEFGIHFFDLARWIAQDEPVEVFAAGSTLIDRRYAEIGQVDTAAVIVRMANGCLFQLDIGWRSACGHDERLEVFGSKGVLASGEPVITIPLSDAEATIYDPRKRLPDWFERFEATYLTELAAFVEALNTGAAPVPALHDGVVAQMVADAAQRSLQMNAPVRLSTAASDTSAQAPVARSW